MSDTKAKTDSPPPSGRTLAKMAGGAQIQAIVPTTLGETFALAEMVHAAGLAPRDIDTPQKLCVVLMKGMELGLPPMAAMECIGVINGKAALHSDGIPALLWAHGFDIEEHYTGEESLDTIVAHCTIMRPNGKRYSFKYSAADAKENGLWDMREKDSKGNPNKAPWFRFKRRMVKMRCRGWLARDCATDVLKGMPIYEEVADFDLGKNEYRDVKPAALDVLDDIPSDDDATVGATPAIDDPSINQDNPIVNPALYLERLDDALGGADSKDELDEVWSSHTESADGRLGRDDQERAQSMFEKHSQRFEA